MVSLVPSARRILARFNVLSPMNDQVVGCIYGAGIVVLPLGIAVLQVLKELPKACSIGFLEKDTSQVRLFRCCCHWWLLCLCELSVTLSMHFIGDGIQDAGVVPNGSSTVFNNLNMTLEHAQVLWVRCLIRLVVHGETVDGIIEGIRLVSVGFEAEGNLFNLLDKGQPIHLLLPGCPIREGLKLGFHGVSALTEDEGEETSYMFGDCCLLFYISRDLLLPDFFVGDRCICSNVGWFVKFSDRVILSDDGCVKMRAIGVLAIDIFRDLLGGLVEAVGILSGVAIIDEAF